MREKKSTNHQIEHTPLVLSLISPSPDINLSRRSKSSSCESSRGIEDMVVGTSIVGLIEKLASLLQFSFDSQFSFTMT